MEALAFKVFPLDCVLFAESCRCEADALRVLHLLKAVDQDEVGLVDQQEALSVHLTLQAFGLVEDDLLDCDFDVAGQ